MTTHIPQNGIATLIHAQNNQAASNEASEKEAMSSLFGEDGFTFGDIIDIVNPLQHIPIVSSLYRKITGDVIAPAMEIAGGALFGGPLGAALSAVTTVLKSQLQNDSNSIDPNSPYYEEEQDNTVTAIASNPLTEKTIGADDYIALEDIDTKQTDAKVNSPNNNGNWILSSTNMVQRHNNKISLNTLQSHQIYQSSDGIVNLVYKKTESYTDVITSTDVPEKKVDIIIGTQAETEAG